jgi:hypothetical protein
MSTDNAQNANCVLIDRIRALPDSITTKLKRVLENTPIDDIDELSQVIDNLDKPQEPGVTAIPKKVADESIAYYVLMETLESLHEGNTIGVPVEWVDEFQPMEAFEVKFKGYNPEIVSFGDFPEPAYFRSVSDKLQELARTQATGGKLGVVRGFKNPGTGLLFNKGSHEEEKLRSLLNDTDRAELIRLTSFSTGVRRSAIRDIAQTKPQGVGYDFVFNHDKDLVYLTLGGYAIAKMKTSSAPEFIRMADESDQRGPWDPPGSLFKVSTMNKRLPPDIRWSNANPRELANSLRKKKSLTKKVNLKHEYGRRNVYEVLADEWPGICPDCCSNSPECMLDCQYQE